jgi:hypothetical protein
MTARFVALVITLAAIVTERRAAFQEPVCTETLHEATPGWHLRTHLLLEHLFDHSVYNIPERDIGHADMPGRNRGHYEFDATLF